MANQPNRRGAYAPLFGTLIVLILLGLYAYTTFVMIQAVRACASDPTCVNVEEGQVTVETDDQGNVIRVDAVGEGEIAGGLIYINTIVAGLVSALVVAELAVTEPGETPGTRALKATGAISDQSSPRVLQVTTIVSALFVVVWIVIGLFSLVYGLMFYEGISPTLTASGTTWLGLAVAAGYSYFGIQPKG